MKPHRDRPRPPYDDDKPLEARPHRARRTPKGDGKRRKLFVLLVLVVIAIGLLPMIVAKTPLRNVIVAAALPTDELRVSVADVSLGWLSGPSLAHVEVADAAGQRLVAAESIRINRSPGQLLFNARELGTIEIFRPSIYLKVRPDGSNLEDVLKQLLTKVAGGAGEPEAGADVATPVSVALKIEDGTIHVDDTTTGRRWRISGVNLEYNTHDTGGLGHGQIAAQLAEVGPDNAALGAAGQFAAAIGPAEGGKCQMSLEADQVPLSFTAPLLERFVSGVSLNGTLSGRGGAQWTPDSNLVPADFITSGSITIDHFDATAPVLAGDRIQLARVELPWRFASQPAGLVIDDLQLRSDLGQLAVRGTLDTGALAQSSHGGVVLADATRQHSVELRGSLDLVRLAKMLPHAINLREGMAITSGSIQLAARCEPAAGGQLVTGSIETAQLAGQAGGRPIHWDQPVMANFKVRRGPGAVRIDALNCDSDFLKIAASGTREQMAATAEFDLNRLAEHLGQFVDLSGVALAGSGTARLNFQQAGPSEFTGRADGELARLRVGIGEWSWSTSQGTLGADLRIVGDAIDVTSGRLAVADLRAAGPGWNIVEPRAELSGDARWNRAAGEIATRSAQLVSSAVSLATKDVRYLATLETDRARGVGQLTGMAAFRADLARLAAWRASATQPPSYQPSGEVVGNVRFARDGDRLTGEVAVTGQNVSLAQFNPANGAVRGPGQNPASNPQIIWQEPQLVIRGRATHESATDRLAFDQIQIQSNTLDATAAGAIERLSTTADVQVNGTLNYDLAQITPLLRPYLGDGIQLTGREQAQFSLAGQLAGSTSGGVAGVEQQRAPSTQVSGAQVSTQAGWGLAGGSTPATPHTQSAIPWSRRARARLQLPWSGASVYGLVIGAGRLAVTLGDGMIRVDPLALTVGQGQLTATPRVRLDPLPAVLRLPPGPLISNVRISPEVSESMLKYFAPVLAGVTESDGLFSMTLDDARVPLSQPKRTAAAGQLTVHSVRVTPGPMAKQWISLAQQIEAVVKRRDPASLANRPAATLLSIKDQQVHFRVAQGRVHHQNMEFEVGDVIMRSQGSVGFDETIALMLSVPIQDTWIAEEPLLASFKGQSLTIPVSGTLKRPKIDERAIASISQQLLHGAAQEAIGGELNKALDKLFKKR